MGGARLTIYVEGDPPRDVELGERNAIGRHPSQSVQLLDRLVSKEHALLENRDGVFVLQDLGSRNGTFVNRKLVHRLVTLADGDEVRVGSTLLIFRDGTTESMGQGRVTLAPPSVQSSLQRQVPQDEAQRFSPEGGISNIEHLRREYERLRLAYELHQDIGSVIDLDALLERLLDYVFATLAVERAAVLLYGESGVLEPRSTRVRPGTTYLHPDDRDIAISHTLLDAVINQKSAVLSSDARLDARFQAAESIIMQGIRSTMCVPLLARDKLLGVLHLDNRLHAGAFTERDLGVLQGLAAQAAVALDNAMLVRRIEADAITRQKFERLLSPNLVDKVVSGELAIEKGGELRDVAVLFTDIRGFTRLSMDQPAAEVVHMLNEYFEAAVEVVFEYEGTLDKYLGDGFLAVWGAPVHTADDTGNAVRAALGILRVLDELNEQRRAEGAEPIGVGVGIDAGEIVAGYMGSSRTMSYTVIGNPVNRGARLCAAAHPGEVLLSEEAFRRVRDVVHAEALEPKALKGFPDRVPCYRVTGWAGNSPDPVPSGSAGGVDPALEGTGRIRRSSAQSTMARTPNAGR